MGESSGGDSPGDFFETTLTHLYDKIKHNAYFFITNIFYSMREQFVNMGISRQTLKELRKSIM